VKAMKKKEERETEEGRSKRESAYSSPAPVLLETVIDFFAHGGGVQSTLAAATAKKEAGEEEGEGGGGRRTHQAPPPSKFMQEVESWRSFSYSLRKEDRDAFNDLVQNISSRYADAIDKSGRGYTTEAFLVSLILFQHRRILWLSRQVEAMKTKLQPPEDGDDETERAGDKEEDKGKLDASLPSAPQRRDRKEEQLR
jgi:hypothetical protein